MPHCEHTQLLTASPMSLSSHPCRLAPEHACLVHPHHRYTRLVPTYSEHTHAHTCTRTRTHMHWAKSPGDLPPLGWLANGYNLILIEPLHCKAVQGLVGTVGRDRWSEESTSTSPLSTQPCFPDPQSPPATLSGDAFRKGLPQHLSILRAALLSTRALEPGSLGAHLKFITDLVALQLAAGYVTFLDLIFLSCQMR